MKDIAKLLATEALEKKAGLGCSQYISRQTASCETKAFEVGRSGLGSYILLRVQGARHEVT